MLELEAPLKILEEELVSLKDRYLKTHIPTDPSKGPETFQHDVKSFCLLSHAAFEDYMEFISRFLMQKIESDFLSKKITLPTLCFLMTYGKRLEIQEKEEQDQPKCFDMTLEYLNQSKKLHSAALKDNHGFSLKYMRKLLIPVGLNPPSTPTLASLKKLAEARGSFAHTLAKSAMYGPHGRATKILTPQEAIDIVKDCLDICKDLKNKATSIW